MAWILVKRKTMPKAASILREGYIGRPPRAVIYESFDLAEATTAANIGWLRYVNVNSALLIFRGLFVLEARHRPFHVHNLIIISNITTLFLSGNT